jgi:hypothetical protein
MGQRLKTMARHKGVIRFTGTIDGLTYYESKYGPLVRKKAGPSSEQVKKEPAFQRLRENGKEFGNCGKATKLLRSVLMPLLKDARDYQVTARLVKLMTGIKNLDTSSARGERTVGVGITNAAAPDLIVGFDFNKAAPLSKVLKKPYTLNTGTGVIGIAGLKSKQDLDYPKGATHAKITGGWARMDFAATPGNGELILTNHVTLPLNGVLNNAVLTPVSLASGAGTDTDIFVLQIVFFQEVNGVEYSLKNGENNSMGIIGLL